ncbi:hypothetical protein F9B16_47800, partial [Actinomadura montaniterrae]
ALRAIYDELGRGFRAAAADLMRRAGSPDPARHGPLLVAFVEGLLFDAVAGAGPEPDTAGLRAAVAAYLDGVLPQDTIPAGPGAALQGARQNG